MGDGTADQVGGTLFDTGLGYPGARFDEAMGTIHGRCFELVADTVDQALVTLDEVEGAVEELYRRRRIETQAGLEAWAYEHGDAVATRAWVRFPAAVGSAIDLPPEIGRSQVEA
ncbi:MAG: gamma-glutamylcyclotransferase [Ilumatobacteraceae bacterium]